MKTGVLKKVKEKLRNVSILAGSSLLILLCSCYKTSFYNLDPIEQQEYIIRTHPTWKPNSSYGIIDTRTNGHEYFDFTPLFHKEKLTIYCKVHFGFEVVTAMYNAKKNKYDYLVVRHKKF